jgi:hypothetical protein
VCSICRHTQYSKTNTHVQQASLGSNFQQHIFERSGDYLIFGPTERDAQRGNPDAAELGGGVTLCGGAEANVGALVGVEQGSQERLQGGGEEGEGGRAGGGVREGGLVGGALGLNLCDVGGAGSSSSSSSASKACKASNRAEGRDLQRLCCVESLLMSVFFHRYVLYSVSLSACIHIRFNRH